VAPRHVWLRGDRATKDIGRLASRVIAVLLVLRVLPTLPGLIHVVASPFVRVPGGFWTIVAANTLLPLALAALCWWAAPTVASWLLPQGQMWPAEVLEVAIARGVGLYLALSALSGILFWLMTLIPHTFPTARAMLPVFAQGMAQLVLGLAVLRWAPDLARRLHRRR
jgi:hypothetical protein